MQPSVKARLSSSKDGQEDWVFPDENVSMPAGSITNYVIRSRLTLLVTSRDIEKEEFCAYACIGRNVVSVINYAVLHLRSFPNAFILDKDSTNAPNNATSYLTKQFRCINTPALHFHSSSS
jgi:hypothetical protein